METILRVTIIYIFIMFGLRVMGKRELGQLSPFDLVILLLIPEIVSQALVREDFSITNALVGLGTLFCLVFVNSMLSFRYRKFRMLTEGRPFVLVHAGKLLSENMQRERVPPDEILSEMHKSGIERLEDVEWAILEPDGKIAIVRSGGNEKTHRSDDSHKAV